MPMKQGMDEAVSILTNYYRGNHQYLIEQYGDQAPALAGEMGEMLDEVFNTETS